MREIIEQYYKEGHISSIEEFSFWQTRLSIELFHNVPTIHGTNGCDDDDPKELYKLAFKSIFQDMFHWDLAKLLSSIYFQDFSAFNEYLIAALTNHHLPAFLSCLFNILVAKELYQYCFQLFCLSNEIVTPATRLKWICLLLQKERYNECVQLFNLSNSLINGAMREIVVNKLIDLKNGDEYLKRIENINPQMPETPPSSVSSSSSDATDISPARSENYLKLINYLSNKANGCTSGSASYRNMACFVYITDMNSRGFDPLQHVLASGSNEPNTKTDSSCAKHAEANAVIKLLHSKALMKKYWGQLLLFSVRFRPNREGEFEVAPGGEICEKCQTTISVFNKKRAHQSLAINKVAWASDKDGTITEKSVEEFTTHYQAPVTGGRQYLFRSKSNRDLVSTTSESSTKNLLRSSSY